MGRWKRRNSNHWGARLNGIPGFPSLADLLDRVLSLLRPRLADINHLRRTSQILCFGLLLFLVLNTTYPLGLRLPADLFLRSDPLIAVVSFLAGKAIIWKLAPALALLGLVMVFGNFFCGWICPLGSVIDISDHLLFRKLKRSVAALHHSSKSKYYILAAVVAASLFSVQALYLLDPISLITRTLIVVFFPPYVSFVNAASSKLHAFFPNYIELSSDWLQPIFKVNLLIFTLFALILMAGSLRKRLWCRYFCPLGALLALSSRFRLLGRRVASSCNDCAKCQRACPMGAIKADPRHHSAQDCILCMRCLDCQPEAVTFAPQLPPLQPARLDLNRRYFLGSTVMGAFSAVVIRSNPLQTPSTRINQRLIRPPAAVPEDRFVSLCTGCGECLKVCPNYALQPTFLEAGLAGMFTPRLVPRVGYCEQHCNLCWKVCPTSAIQAFSVEEKPRIQIGLAHIDRTRCLIWADDILCIVCNEVCSYNAVYLDEKKRPYVDREKCTGCGICEYKCPVIGEAAIVVYSQGPVQRRLPERKKV